MLLAVNEPFVNSKDLDGKRAGVHHGAPSTGADESKAFVAISRKDSSKFAHKGKTHTGNF